MSSAWTVIIPVKSLESAKSRLDSASATKASAAYAFFQDALAAVAACTRVERVIVTTSDPTVSAWAAEHGADTFDDSEVAGINAAAAEAAQSLGADGSVAVIVSDLPCLTAAALGIVLSAAADQRQSFVRDVAGTGTTMWFTTRGQVASRFGPDSAAAHISDGAVDLATTLPGSQLAPARRDVDTQSDLDEALSIGVGVHTAALFTAIRVVTVARESIVDPTMVVPVVDEDGRWSEVPGRVLADAGFRLVRVGQRLVVESDADNSAISARLQ